jgi:hypothetical protein
VNNDPSVNISPSSVALDVGQSQTFTSTVVNGTSQYSYQWYLNGSSTGVMTSSYTFVPSSNGHYNIYVTVTDSVGFQVSSNTAVATVNAVPSVTVSPASAVLDVGQSQVFTSNIVNGTLPYSSYQWYLDGVAQGTSLSWIFAPTSSGSYSVYLNVTDYVGVMVKSNNVAVTVNPSLSVAINPAAAVIIFGQGENFSATITGGSSPYSFQWFLGGVLRSTNSSWVFTPNMTGVYSPYVRVTDTANQATNSTSAQLAVIILSPPPSTSTSPSPPASPNVIAFLQKNAVIIAVSGSITLAGIAIYILKRKP